jgi:hypothetical protein
MLTEFPNLSQPQPGFRQLFFDEYLDLYVWYDRPGGEITGFQLVYSKEESPRSLTWKKREGFRHDRIDEGENRLIKMSPVLVRDGVLDTGRLLAEFESRSAGIEEVIRSMVKSAIEEYNPGGENRLM